MTTVYTLTKQDLDDIAIAIYKTANELLNGTSVAALSEKLQKLAQFAECGLTQSDVNLDIWLTQGRMNKSIFEM